VSDTSGEADQGRGHSPQVPDSGHGVWSRAPARPTRFDRVRRGYDCAQVDAHLDELGGHLEQVEAYVIDLAAAAVVDRERADLAEEQLRTVLDELHALRAVVPGEDSFGARAQRTLRLAERQADEIRARAVEEASIVLGQVRVAAQAALDELRRALLARVDAEGRRLDAALTEHGHQVAASMAAPRARSVEAARDAAAEDGVPRVQSNSSSAPW
jgi:DivIVA domain-containing protein